MRTMLIVACAGALLWAVTPAEAQLLRRPGAAPAPAVQPAPAPPAAAQPATPPPAPLQTPANVQGEIRTEGQGALEGRREQRTEVSRQAESFSARAGAAGGEAHGHSRVFRGSTLVGMTIWAGENQKVGVVKEILFDPRGGCIQHVVLESPMVEQQWVVIPFDVFHLSFNAQQHEHLVLDMPADRLRHAPHIGVNQWEMIHNPQFFTQMQQFSQRIERTTARPTGEEAFGAERRMQEGGQAEAGVRGERRTEGTMPERQPTGDVQQPPADTSLRDEVRKEGQQRDMQREQRQGTESQTDQPQAGDAQRRGETQRQERQGTEPQTDRPTGGQQPQGDRPSGQPQSGRLEGQSRSPSQGSQPQTDRPQGGQSSGDSPSSNR